MYLAMYQNAVLDRKGYDGMREVQIAAYVKFFLITG